MQRNLTTLALALAALAPTGLAQDAKPLSIGDRAPALAVGKWIKGEPVTELGNGAVTVLDFWATWCGPCIRAIPHMSEIQAKYADQKVNVIGVSIWERSPSGVVPFVEARDKNETKGDEMAYRVTMDDVPPLPQGVEEGGKEAAEHAGKGKMANTWMRAAGRNGIPTVFIVDRDGMIAWIGHPMDGMDEALAQITAGTWDIEAAKQAQEQAAMTQRVMAQIQKKLKASQFDAAFALASEHIEGALADDANALNWIAWLIVDPAGPVENKDLELALKAAERANELTEGKAPPILDTLARVHFLLGNLDRAISIQRSAVELAEEGMDEGLRATLEEYEAVARKKGETADMAF